MYVAAEGTGQYKTYNYNYKNDSENLLYTNVDPQLFLTMWTVNMIYFIGKDA